MKTQGATKDATVIRACFEPVGGTFDARDEAESLAKEIVAEGQETVRRIAADVLTRDRYSKKSMQQYTKGADQARQHIERNLGVVDKLVHGIEVYDTVLSASGAPAAGTAAAVRAGESAETLLRVQAEAACLKTLSGLLGEFTRQRNGLIELRGAQRQIPPGRLALIEAAEARLREAAAVFDGDGSDASAEAARRTLAEVGQLHARARSKGFDARGAASVEAIRDREDRLTHWVLRFENTGTQPFMGTAVLPSGSRRKGIGFDAMALPARGTAAEQDLIHLGDYGGIARVGSLIRFGVRGHSWIERELPERGAIHIPVEEFTVEEQAPKGQPFDERVILSDRERNFMSGRVRYYANDRPWTFRKQKRLRGVGGDCGK